jgi:hypothetical protein
MFTHFYYAIFERRVYHKDFKTTDYQAGPLAQAKNFSRNGKKQNMPTSVKMHLTIFHTHSYETSSLIE